MTTRQRRTWVAGLALVLASAGIVWAGASASRTARARPVLAVLPVPLNLSSANMVQPQDHTFGQNVTEQLRAELEKNGVYELASQAAVARALASARSEGECQREQCVKEIGRAAGADLMLSTTLSKLSNLIWTVSGHLFEVRTGRVVHSESLELKGKPGEMIPAGIASLARRMSAAVPANLRAAR